MEVNELLRADVPKELVSMRAGPGGQKVAYMEASDVFDSANEIFGFDGWGSRIVSVDVDYCEETNGVWHVSVSARCHVWAGGGGHEDIGHHSSKGKDRGEVLGNAKKAAVTDAKKRALRIFGSRLGGMVYNNDKVKRVMKRTQPLPKRPC